jgi:hypothetical protein
MHTKPISPLIYKGCEAMSLEQLVADAKESYAAGVCRPIRHEYFVAPTCQGCGMTAAYLKSNPRPKYSIDGSEAFNPIKEFVMDKYRLTENELHDFMRGFDYGDQDKYRLLDITNEYNLAGAALADLVFPK